MVTDFFKRHGGTILTVLASIGVVGTAYLAGRAAVKAKEELDTLGEDAPIQEKVRAVAPIYIPPAAAGAATIACMFGANTLSRRQQASMLAAGAIVERTFKKYKDKAEELLGKNAVENELAKDDIPDDVEYEDGKKLYYYNYLEDGEFLDPAYEAYFRAYPEQQLQLQGDLNRIFVLRGKATLNDMLKLMGQDPIDGGDELGWSEEIGRQYFGYNWIDIQFDEVHLEDGMVCTVITTPFPPTMLA